MHNVTQKKYLDLGYKSVKNSVKSTGMILMLPLHN